MKYIRIISVFFLMQLSTVTQSSAMSCGDQSAGHTLSNLPGSSRSVIFNWIVKSLDHVYLGTDQPQPLSEDLNNLLASRIDKLSDDVKVALKNANRDYNFSNEQSWEFLLEELKKIDDLTVTQVASASSVADIISILTTAGWVMTDPVYSEGDQNISLSEFGLQRLRFADMTVYLDGNSPKITREDTLKLSLALDAGRLFVSKDAIPAYIATRASTTDMVTAMNTYFPMITGRELIKNVMDGPSGDNYKNHIYTYRHSEGRLSIRIETPLPQGFTISINRAKIEELIDALNNIEVNRTVEIIRTASD